MTPDEKKAARRECGRSSNKGKLRGHLTAALDQLDADEGLRATNRRLNRRCQAYEAALAEKIDRARAEYRNLGRMLANAAAEKAEADNERLWARFTVPVVCICGSTRFADEHAIARWMLERTGKHICVMINYLPAWYAEEQGWNGHDHFGEASGTKDALDELHKRKIDLCDWVLVVAPEGYIGSSTRAEIEYAESLGRPVRYVEQGILANEKGAGDEPDANEGAKK